MGAPATDIGHSVEPPTVTSALDRMVDAAQQVVVDQVRLARLEAQTALADTARDSAMIGAGVIVLLTAWVFAMIALQSVLARWIDPAAGHAIVAGANAVIGAGLVAAGRSRTAGGAQENAHGST